ncbi:hypothetical protein KY362_08125, partial [Candidatus Woesearchaeota archaeon]|nr:hypothetical protein [Candidatus Woesearchaeota archaeon]
MKKRREANMTLVDSIILHKWAILFYLAILLVIYINRSKFDIHHRILAMYRTKIGLNFMDRIGRKHAELIKFIGYIGIGAGYLGLFFIVGFLIKSMIDIFRVPDAQAAVSVILPGVHVPGSPLYIPLISGWIALFIVILVHESSHGIVARAHGLKIKSS